MAIVIKSKKIKEEIVDENGNVLGIISYNPEDTGTYTKLTDIMQDILDINDKIKSIGDIKEISNNINTMEEFENYRVDFNKISDALHFQDEKIKNIKKTIDDIFGKDTSKIIMEESNDVELLIPLIQSVMPHFEKVRNKNVSRYLNEEKIENLEVME